MIKFVEKIKVIRKPTKNIVVLYHNDCTDGFSSAWVAWKKLGDKADYIGINPGTAPIDGLKNKEIYMLDLIYPTQYLNKLIIDNKKFYLHHGDGIDKRGLFKKIALGFLRSKGAIVLSRLIGPNLLWKVGQKLSHSSRQYGPVVSGARDRYRNFGKKILIENNYDYFIVGHTHIPDEYEVAKGKWYYNVGDWVRNYTYLEYLDGTFAIKKVR